MTSSKPVAQPAVPDTALSLLRRIADALERWSPPARPPLDFFAASAFEWNPAPDPGRPPGIAAATGSFIPVGQVSAVPLSLLKTIRSQKNRLWQNTQQFAQGNLANNALLWGARGMGKSALVKAVHQHICAQKADADTPLKLIEIHREDLSTLPACLAIVRRYPHRFILFCDDLSFEPADMSYKALKAVLEGGLSGRPDNVLFYATSNRRHLIPRDMVENERSTAIHPAEAVEEKVSLSDRFGLWIGFHSASQPDYLEMVDAYAKHFGLINSDEFPCQSDLHAKAIAWAASRGARSGRVAWQFITHHRAGTKPQANTGGGSEPP